jgi:hypothetical protein
MTATVFLGGIITHAGELCFAIRKEVLYLYSSYTYILYQRLSLEGP